MTMYLLLALLLSLFAFAKMSRVSDGARFLPLVAAVLLCLMMYQAYTAEYQNPQPSIKFVNHYISDVIDSPGAGVPGQEQVFLVTRGRSGSSFTSELISYHPKVFFFHEPLQSLDDWFYLRSDTQKMEDHKNGVIGFNIWGDKKWKSASEVMEEFFTCNLSNHRAMNIPVFRRYNDTMDMTHCLDDKKKSGWQHLKCYLEMIQSCKNRDIVFAKSIRYRIKWTEEQLRKHPNFKLIFLIRDPRAVLNSQSRVWPDWFNWSRDIHNVSLTYCRELEEDISQFQRLKEIFPQRLKVVRYEDGVLDPYKYTQDIYSFLNLEYTKDIQDHIHKITHTKPKKSFLNGAFEVVRENPLASSQAWRHRSDFKTISVIDEHCGKLYPLLGYRKVTSHEDLRSNRTLILKRKY